MRDEALKERIQDVYTSNYRVYGARKIWRELNRQGHAVARCTVERLMREFGIQGAVRGKLVITTIPGGQVQRAPSTTICQAAAATPGLRRGLGTVSWLRRKEQKCQGRMAGQRAADERRSRAERPAVTLPVR
ncbi:IS3 family transposase [Streptomyces massasporeus]|uniref:IS3 family transposase n=1 Tax=Streptomyces massasporeus TaxID=67324 RepID=UPI0037FEE3AF